VNDVSGHGNDGTLHGGVSWVPGSMGMGLKFPTGSYCHLNPIQGLSGSGAFGFGFWFSTAVTGANQELIRTDEHLSTSPIVIFRVDSGTNKLRWFISDGGSTDDISSTATVTDGKLHFGFAFHSPGLHLLYLDSLPAVIATSTVTANPFQSAGWTIGGLLRAGPTVTENFQGRILGGLATSALPIPAQVSTLYNNPYGMFTRRATRFGKSAASGGLLLRRRRAAA
jgi:hypothetical protein